MYMQLQGNAEFAEGQPSTGDITTHLGMYNMR